MSLMEEISRSNTVAPIADQQPTIPSRQKRSNSNQYSDSSDDQAVENVAEGGGDEGIIGVEYSKVPRSSAGEN